MLLVMNFQYSFNWNPNASLEADKLYPGSPDCGFNPLQPGVTHENDGNFASKCISESRGIIDLTKKVWMLLDLYLLFERKRWYQFFLYKFRFHNCLHGEK